jgi:hypothetical protein
MTKLWFAGGLLSIASAACAQPQACTPGAAQQAADRALALQRQLLGMSVEEMSTDVPPQMKPVLHQFKQALIATVEVALRCDDPEPGSIQAELATWLHANRPPKPFIPEPARPDWKPGDPPPTNEGTYGDELKVQVAPAPGEPASTAIDLSYAIECGDDHILLLFQRSKDGWSRELVYQNPDLNSTGDAFGDFLSWTLVPGPQGQTLFAAAHGTPWCTSRFSNFKVDLLTLAAPGRPQHLVEHREYSYSRGDHTPALKRTSDGFAFRADSIPKDIDLYSRPWIYRFRTTAGSLERTQPIAENARDFVDEWLQMPWKQSSRFADKPGAALQQVRDRFDYDLNKETPEVHYGAVRACGARRFQVEIDLTSAKHQAEKLYAQVLEGSNGYTLLSIELQPDSACTGADLMKPRQP